MTTEEIAAAKARTQYTVLPVLHEHDDCIRIAYEWLDAQKTTKNIGRVDKHLVERWGGRYVSTSDVEVAAELHPRIKGAYPRFNISRRLVCPSDSRLADIPSARIHHQHDQRRQLDDKTTYATWEGNK